MSFAQRIFAGFGLIIALLLIVVVSAYDLFFSLLHTNALIAHSQEVRAELSGLLSAVEEAETGQRGYLLTGEKRYLQPYSQAQQSVEPHLLRLARLTADNVEQRREMPVLRQRTQSKLNELRQTLAFYDQRRFGDALRTVRSDEGRKQMEAIRQIIGRMRATENRLLLQRTQAVRSSAGRTLFALTVLVGLICALLGMTLQLIRRYLWERRQSDAVHRRMVTVQEDERRRISRELHDEMGQYLTALMLGLNAVGSAIEENTPLHTQILQLQHFSRQVGQDIHRIAWELRPTALDDMGLEVALRNLLEEWSERAEVATDYHGSGKATERLPAEIETTLYRSVQEALTNIAKHAQAERVSVILERQEDHVRLIVEDDGVGIERDTLPPPKSRQTLGLIGMKERIAMVGGSFTLESTPGQGTTLFLRIPLTREASAGRASEDTAHTVLAAQESAPAQERIGHV